MKPYFYIQAIVTQSHTAVEPFVEPGGIEFRHCRVQAKNITKAYSEGFKVLGRIPDGADAMNDYVISLEGVE